MFTISSFLQCIPDRCLYWKTQNIAFDSSENAVLYNRTALSADISLSFCVLPDRPFQIDF